MDYHLHCHGADVGVFALEELRRRRAAGELTGAELVWCEGMANWAPLEAVLRTAGAPAIPQPPPVPAAARKRENHRVLIWGGVGLAVLVVLGFTVIGPMMVKFSRGVRHGLNAVQHVRGREGVGIAGQPVVVGTNSRTEKIVHQQGREFRVRQYVQAYQQFGPHTAPWDRDAARLIESWLAYNYDSSTNLPSPQTLADQLAGPSGCDDPLVLTVAAANSVEVHERARRLERALSAFPTSHYRAYPKLYATVLLANDLGSTAPRIRSLDEQALRFLKEALKDGSFQVGDEEELAEILVNGWAENLFKRNGPGVCLAVERAGRYPWLTQVLQGEKEVNEAWKARGSGWGNQVTAEGWQGFTEHLAKGRVALEGAWHVHPERPLAAARMITVAMGESDLEEMRTWFDRATAAQIDYSPAWVNMRWGLRPRWFGSQEALLAFGVRAVETKRFDTDVPRKFFDVVSDLEAELAQPPGEHIYGRSDIWPHFKELYEGYLAAPSEAPRRDGWRSTYAAVAYLAGEYPVARAQLEALHWQPLPQNLTAWGTDLSLMPLKVAALTGKSSNEVQRAEAGYEQQDLVTALKVYAELSASTEADERTIQFSRCRLAALKQEEQLAKGEWIDLLPADDKDPNWELLGSTVRRVPEGALEVESGSQGHTLYCRTRVGPEFEVTGTFEVVRSSTQDFQAGVVMGLPDSSKSDWYAFRMKRNAVEGQVAVFSRGWSASRIARKATLNEGQNTFQFRLQEGKADAWVNGIQVLHKATLGKTLRLSSDCLLGLGAYNDTNETVIRYRNLKARRLVPGT
jgi:hypothetical protein